MSRLIQIYNPTHNQHVKRARLNIMGRALSKDVQHVTAYMDRTMIRRVRVGNSGSFECRIDLTGLDGKHEIEIRSIIGHRTERLVIPIIVSLEQEDGTTADPEESAASPESVSPVEAQEEPLIKEEP